MPATMSIAIMLLRGYAYRDIYLEPDMHIYIILFHAQARALCKPEHEREKVVSCGP